VAQLSPHPDPGTDLLLVRLAVPAPLGPGVEPACLPGAHGPPAGSSCVLASWAAAGQGGDSLAPRAAPVLLLPQTACPAWQLCGCLVPPGSVEARPGAPLLCQAGEGRPWRLTGLLARPAHSNTTLCFTSVLTERAWLHALIGPYFGQNIVPVPTRGLL
jgi:hypothetical protein